MGEPQGLDDGRHRDHGLYAGSDNLDGGDCLCCFCEYQPALRRVLDNPWAKDGRVADEQGASGLVQQKHGCLVAGVALSGSAGLIRSEIGTVLGAAAPVA